MKFFQFLVFSLIVLGMHSLKTATQVLNQEKIIDDLRKQIERMYIAFK